MEQHAVHIEWVEITVAELIDSAGDVCDQVSELCLVIGGHLLACLLTRCLLGHLLRLVRLSFDRLALIAADPTFQVERPRSSALPRPGIPLPENRGGRNRSRPHDDRQVLVAAAVLVHAFVQIGYEPAPENAKPHRF